MIRFRTMHTSNDNNQYGRLEMTIGSKEQLMAFLVEHYDKISPEQFRSIVGTYYGITILGKPSLERCLECIEIHEKHLENGDNPTNFHTGYLDFKMNRDWLNLPIWKN
jgi:hypothetical protein